MAADEDELTGIPDAARLPVLAIVGPTASGKSGIAMKVAATLEAEIVAVDSMTIYRGMDIGTAKPSLDDRRAIPHHMIDVADPAAPYSVARFQRAARAAISAVHARGRLPLLVGGSGLYFRSVVDDLVFPPTDPATRARLEQTPADELRERLAASDPESAERIDAANLRRIVRALEVAELTGSPFSAFRASWDAYESRYDLTAAGLFLAAEELDARIARRTRAMIDAGLVGEVARLLELGLRDALTASRAIAYKEIVAHLDGELSLDEAVSMTETATRRYARRQMMWFRRDPRIRWFDAADPERAAGQIELLAKTRGLGAGAR